MVNTCAVVGCGKRSDRDKEISFYRLPAEVSHQGEKTKELSKKRRELWLSRLHRANSLPTSHTRVCSLHFAGGREQLLSKCTGSGCGCNGSILPTYTKIKEVRGSVNEFVISMYTAN